MTTEQKSLWNRVEQFSLDEANVSLPFSRRLARENRWSHAQALRAIAEYKKFMFLGCMAGHPVSPSEDVDQVWHLHLAYSKSYWKDFCGEVLQRPFHHEPTKGGATESAKFEDWYAKTLASYRSFFGIEPPADIWPARPVHHELKWVDIGSNWVIPKPRWAAVASAILAMAILFTAGCGGSDFNVFNLRGPDFLSFFWPFAIIIFVGAFLWRRKLIAGLTVAAPDGVPLDTYELAYLAGKNVSATNAAIVALTEQKYVKVGDDGKMEIRQQAPPNAALHPLERSLIDGASLWSATHLKEVRARAKDVLQDIHKRLQDRGLLYDLAETVRARRYPLMLVMMVPIVGLIKIVVGILRDRPVTILVFATIFAAVAGVLIFGRRPFQTPAGNEALKKAREENYRLQTAPTVDGVSMLPMAVGLFGLGTLAGTPYETMQKALVPRTGADSSYSYGSSGCSGGGCGGGGCGGCGGD